MTTARNASRVSLIFGVVYLGAALFGLIPAALSPPDPGAPPLAVNALHGKVFGLFHVNALHTLVHLVIGIWGILAATGRFRAAVFLRTLAVFYGALAIMGLIPGLHTMFGLVPLHGHDVWLHAGTALIAGWFGFRAPADGPATSVGSQAAGR